MIAKNGGNRLLTTKEVAEMLGIAPRTLCTRAECNEIPAMKIGRQWRFQQDEISTWLDEFRQSARLEERLKAAGAQPQTRFSGAVTPGANASKNSLMH